MKRIKISLTGVETNNKGAELMLYAILQEIERKFPNAIVYMPYGEPCQGKEYKIETTLNLKPHPDYVLNHVLHKFRIRRISRWLLGDSFTKKLRGKRALRGMDYHINASGYTFADCWAKTDDFSTYWKNLIDDYYHQGTKQVFLPQAVGPLNERVKDIITFFSSRINLFFPREKVSYAYLKEAGFPKEKMQLFTDFTSLVKGRVTDRYKYLHSGICIIPNLRMIDKGAITFEDYRNLLSSIIQECKKTSRPVYLLNHEGPGDEKLAYQCKEALNGEIEVVSGLNALEVKGIISTAYLVVTSRFHGVASALNSCVPCLATSWSHKYAELFHDYELSNCILPLDDFESSLAMVNKYLDETENREMRKHLSKQLPRIQNETIKMWNLVWSIDR